MTRGEAIEKYRKGSESIDWHPVDALIELGLLKVDEPKSLRDKFIDAMKKRGLFHDERQNALSAYDEAHK